MMKRVILTAVAAMFIAGPAMASTTYVILPSPGSMAPATVYVDETGGKADRVFVCDNVNQILAGTCRAHTKARRISADQQRKTLRTEASLNI